MSFSDDEDKSSDEKRLEKLPRFEVVQGVTTANVEGVTGRLT